MGVHRAQDRREHEQFDEGRIRDLRDRQGRRQPRWRTVAVAGMAASGGMAFVRIQPGCAMR